MDEFDRAVGSLDQYSVGKALGSLDANPDDGARALQLAKATGAPPTFVHNDMEHFEQGYRTKLTADIVGKNETIAHYVMHHPLADVVSNDDYGNLDNFTRSAPIAPWAKALDESAGVTWLTATQAGIERAAQKTYEAVTAPPQIEPGTEYVPGLSAVGDIANKAFGAFLAPITGFASGFTEEAIRQTVGEKAAGQFGYSAEREAENLMQALPGLGGHATEIARGAFAMRETEAMQNAQAFRDMSVAHTEALNHARPYLDVGQEPPVGLHPTIDQAKAFHNADYIAQLGEHLNAAQSSLTRERSAEYFQWIADKVNGDHSVSVDGDAVAQLYGDRLPAPDDGLLGWVPGIEEKLALARDSGTRVSIPAGALVTHMEPEIYKQLSPFMRAWDGGISEADAKIPWEYKPTVEAPMPQVRGVTGLEPMFGIGDKKLALQRATNIDPMLHEYQFLDQNGKPAGELTIVPEPENGRLYVANINGLAGLYSNSFGPSLMRDLVAQLKGFYPEFVGPDGKLALTGFRVTGARERAGTVDTVPIGEVRLGVDGPTAFKDYNNFRTLMERSYGKGLVATPIPSELLSGRLAEVSQIVHEEVSRITGIKPDVVAGIKFPGFAEDQAVHGAYFNGKILADLFSPDPVGYARHESIHYLRRNGLLDNATWATLVKASRDEGWIERYDIEGRYGPLGLTEFQKHEEAIAEAFRDWAKNPEGQPVTPVTTFFEKLAQLWENIKARLAELFGREVTSEELFQGIHRGDFAGEEAGGGAGPRFALDPSVIDSQLEQLRANTLGLNEKTWKNIQALLEERFKSDLEASLKRAERDQRVTQTKAWKAESEVIAKEVGFDIIRRPDVMADQFVGAGKLIGEQLPAYRYPLGEKYLTSEQKAVLPRHYYREDGLPPDQVAKILGIPSGDAMLDAMTRYHSELPGMSANERLAAATKAETDRRMEAQFGDLQKNIMLDAQDQAMKENDINLVLEEWQAVAMQNGGGPIDKDMVRAQALAEFGARNQKEVKYTSMLREVGDLGKKAHDFLANGDSASALIALERRAKAMVQAVEAKKLEQLRGQFDKVAKQSNKQFNDGYTPTIDPTHNLFAQQILNQVEMKTRRSMADIAEFTAARGFDSLEKFSEAAVGDGKEMPVWPQLFDTSWKKNVKDLTVDEYTAMANSVRTIIHNGKQDLRINRLGDVETFAEAKEALIDSLAQSAGDKVYTKDKRSGLRSYYVSNLQMENILNRWDGFDSKGRWNQYIMRELIDSNNRMDAMKKEFAKRLKDLGTPGDLKAAVENNLFFDQDKETPIAMQRKNLLTVMLNMGTEDNFNKLAAGYRRNHSPMAQPPNGARNCSGAGSEAVAATTMVYSMAPASSSVLTICATVERF